MKYLTLFILFQVIQKTVLLHLSIIIIILHIANINVSFRLQYHIYQMLSYLFYIEQ